MTSNAVPTIVRRAFGNEILFKLTTENTGGRLSLGLATVPAGKGGPPPHIHHHGEEVFLVLEGFFP